MSLASFSGIVKCLWVRSGAYPRVEELKSASPGMTLALPSNIRLRLARDKHSSLLWKFVNYGCKKFYKIGPRWKLSKPHYKLLTKFDSNVKKIFWTQPFSLSQISCHFISLMSKIFFSAQISHLPRLAHDFIEHLTVLVSINWYLFIV